MSSNRREFLLRGGLLLSYVIGGQRVTISPAQAKEQGVAYRILSAEEVRLVEALGNVLAPGAAEAGFAQFLDHQLAADPNDNLLMARYFNVPLPYADFYRGGLAALNALSMQRHKAGFTQLQREQQEALVREISAAQPEGWQGPPAPLFYLLIRSDAVDVVYGTVEGFERLGIPYMEHILPPGAWS